MTITRICMALLLSGCSPAQPALDSCVPHDDIVDRFDRSGMAWVPAGRTTIGSTRFHPEEAPERVADIQGFWIDRQEVTNREFAAFVRATGYRTSNERRDGGAVFGSPLSISNLEDVAQWWKLDPAASWRSPRGANGRPPSPDEPVLQVTHEDAMAYARWRGRDLPTEEEWERAARGGLAKSDFTWGNESRPARPMANHWQGIFPVSDSGGDGYKEVAPVGCFPPNGYGLHDMAGNVWELTKSRWPGSTTFEPVIKGGSWLCADNFCLRYRPSARQQADPTLGTDHIGFRTVVRPRRP